jgi:hypothetical protein
MKGIWAKYRNKGKYERLGKPLQESARLNTISWDFSRGEINLGVLEMPCTSQNTAARTTQLAQRLEKKQNSKTYKNRMRTIESSLEANERNMGEILRNKGTYER